MARSRTPKYDASEVITNVPCTPTLDRRKLEFSGSFTMTGW